MFFPAAILLVECRSNSQIAIYASNVLQFYRLRQPLSYVFKPDDTGVYCIVRHNTLSTSAPSRKCFPYYVTLIHWSVTEARRDTSYIRIQQLVRIKSHWTSGVKQISNKRIHYGCRSRLQVHFSDKIRQQAGRTTWMPNLQERFHWTLADIVWASIL